MARILVTEKIADTGLARLRDAGHEVVIREGLSADGLLDEIASANAHHPIGDAGHRRSAVAVAAVWSSSGEPASVSTTSTSRRRRATA